ncbi:MAG: phosphate/phosphite/phosphonate ABC transporter substrate-binding protein [Candidatus Methanoperedens sp.]|nr:phosphate/phosphite/phosphonate ABC transporter substrate-binding protein [Candidatus Methanoperedens sp.]
MNMRWIYVVLAIALVAGLAGYYTYINLNDDIKNSPEQQKTGLSRNTRTITIGTDSYYAAKQLTEFQPLADYIALKLSDDETIYEGRVVVVKTVDNVTDLLKEKKIDLYIASPFTVYLVSKKSGAIIFLRGWRDGVPQYHSLFVVRNDSSIRTLQDFLGKTIAFQTPESSSGYLLPRAHFLEKGLNLSQSDGKNSVKYIFTEEEEENIVLWVIEGKADIAALSNLNFDKLVKSRKDELKIIDRTIDVPRLVVSYRSDIDPSLLERIRQVLLDMDKDPQISSFTTRTKKYDEISEEEINNISRLTNLLD